jgi:hypothetical protein
MIRLAHLLIDLGVGGAENGVVNVVNGLDQRRFAPSIYVFHTGYPLEHHLQRHVRLWHKIAVALYHNFYDGTRSKCIAQAID